MSFLAKMGSIFLLWQLFLYDFSTCMHLSVINAFTPLQLLPLTSRVLEFKYNFFLFRLLIVLICMPSVQAILMGDYQISHICDVVTTVACV